MASNAFNRSVVLIVLALGFAVGCAVRAPFAPVEAAPLHHNIPATFVGHPEGPIVWLCATQPRRYVAPSGTVTFEEDHYLQYEACPVTPIQ